MNSLSPNKSSQNTPDKKPTLSLSPFKTPSSSNSYSPLPTQNKYGLFTQTQSYSSLVKSRVAVPTPSISNQFTVISP